MRRTNIERSLGTTGDKKGSRFSTSQRNSGRAAKQYQSDEHAARALQDIFTTLLPETARLLKGE